MILKFKTTSCNSISTWIYYEADEVIVHKKFGDDIIRCNNLGYSFYSTDTTGDVIPDKQGQRQIYNYILLRKQEIGREEEDKIIVIPVSHSEIYVLSNKGSVLGRV